MKQIVLRFQLLSCGMRRLRWFDRRRCKRSLLGLSEPQILRFDRGRHQFEIRSQADRYVGYCDGTLLFHDKQRHRVARKLLHYRP